MTSDLLQQRRWVLTARFLSFFLFSYGYYYYVLALTGMAGGLLGTRAHFSFFFSFQTGWSFTGIMIVERRLGYYIIRI